MPNQPTNPELRTETAAYLAALEERMQVFFQEQRQILEQISEEALPLLEAIEALSAGGKRLRALLAYWGWRGAGGQAGDQGLVDAGLALELFQTAALIHDDMIDASDTRRGAPSVHRRFEAMHQLKGYKTSPAHFGSSSALLAGDLCLSWSEMAFAAIPQLQQASQARAIFDLMRTEVMAGQYLDVLGEVIPQEEADLALSRAQKVIRYKSAKYSCEHPLVLGGALALGLKAQEDSDLLAGYRAFALPLGEGFQLRDDVLGVFGQPEKTGKPAGDDLREGKRTVLTALTSRSVGKEEALFLEQSLGNPDLSGQEILALQELIRSSGALDEVETIIQAKGDQALEQLAALPLDPLPREALTALAYQALNRSA